MEILYFGESVTAQLYKYSQFKYANVTAQCLKADLNIQEDTGRDALGGALVVTLAPKKKTGVFLLSSFPVGFLVKMMSQTQSGIQGARHIKTSTVGKLFFKEYSDNIERTQ